jgi:hypothetical protein
MMLGSQKIKEAAGTSGACTNYSTVSKGRSSIGRATGSGLVGCRFDPYRPCFRGVAQLAERRALDSKAAGSIPAAPVFDLVGMN